MERRLPEQSADAAPAATAFVGVSPGMHEGSHFFTFKLDKALSRGPSGVIDIAFWVVSASPFSLRDIESTCVC